jgi:hypothetical protein
MAAMKRRRRRRHRTPRWRRIVSHRLQCDATPGPGAPRCFPGPGHRARRPSHQSICVNHIDTAQYYGPDVANELIHAALHPYRRPGESARWCDRDVLEATGFPSDLSKTCWRRRTSAARGRQIGVVNALVGANRRRVEGGHGDPQANSLDDPRATKERSRASVSAITIDQLRQATLRPRVCAERLAS